MDRTNRGGWLLGEEKASRAELMLGGADEEAPTTSTSRAAIKTTTIGNDGVRYCQGQYPYVMGYMRWHMLEQARGGS
ncbi:unnamed protein product [Clonostachys solani]|uniref:Uncharacterized protein n=1 Tax=Clonostachys solani TaxID=160281 RepID=A0A9N9VYJ4_9HYPO|nr:unnamed protein product [Clonostachys solani]